MVNHEIVTLAVLLVGGDLKFVDTEDVAMKANTLAPGRFTWRKYKDQINIENVRTFLKDATQEKNGALLQGSGKQGWMLTAAGLSFAKNRLPDFSSADAARRRPTRDDEQLTKWRTRETGRLRATDAYEKWRSGRTDSLTAADAEGFFRIDDYVIGGDRDRRVQRILNLCTESGEAELVAVAERLVTFIKRD
jgi:hypothetical protein